MKTQDDIAARWAVFPVVLFDGERETVVGNIKIHQDLVFMEFQTMLSQMIGISYNDLTTYLVDNKHSKISAERRMIEINGDVNFAAVVRVRNCYFFVVLKRSRTECQMIPGNQSDLLRMHWNLLDKNKNKNNAQMSADNADYYDDRFRDLLIHRENYLNMKLNSRYGHDSPLNVSTQKIEDVYPRVQSRPDRTLCEDCAAAQWQGRTAEFHLCVYDEVVVGFFRSPAGLISRRR